jgi:hypothetical protein
MVREFNSKVMDQILKEFELHKSDIDYVGDISDLGNEVGFIVGRVFNKMTDSEINDFIIGFSHGVSLTNGTHK